MDFTPNPDDQYLHFPEQKLMKREPLSPVSNSYENEFLEFVTSPLKTFYESSIMDITGCDWITDSKLILNHGSPDYMCDFCEEEDFMYLNEFVTADDSMKQITTAASKLDQNNIEVYAKTDHQVVKAERNNNPQGSSKAVGTPKKVRKGYSKGANASVLNVEEIQKYFDMPISMAAKKMNVGLTLLKKRCRELNIMRWPHRKIMSLKSLINNVKELGQEKELEKLEGHKKIVEKMPQVELTDTMKKLRQACFKAKYKKKKQMRAAAAGRLHLIK